MYSGFQHSDLDLRNGQVIVFLVLCGHRLMQEPLLLGNMDAHIDLWLNNLGHALRGCTTIMKLISNPCYLSAWKSQRSSFSAAAMMAKNLFLWFVLC